jgi:hypothetical protein
MTLQQGTRQLDQFRVVDIMFLVANQQLLTVQQPPQGSFHHSATWLTTTFAGDPHQWASVKTHGCWAVSLHARLNCRTYSPVAVFLVYLHIGTLDDESLDRHLEQLHLRDERPGKDHTQQAAVAHDQERLLSTLFATIGCGIARVFPLKPSIARSTGRCLSSLIRHPEFVAFLDQGQPDLVKDALASLLLGGASGGPSSRRRSFQGAFSADSWSEVGRSCRRLLTVNRSGNDRHGSYVSYLWVGLNPLVEFVADYPISVQGLAL